MSNTVAERASNAAGAPARSTRWSRPPSSTTSIPRAWLTDVLARLQDHPARRLDELLPWNWKRARLQQAAA
jgi:hypothetical protein